MATCIGFAPDLAIQNSPTTVLKWALGERKVDTVSLMALGEQRVEAALAQILPEICIIYYRVEVSHVERIQGYSGSSVTHV